MTSVGSSLEEKLASIRVQFIASLPERETRLRALHAALLRNEAWQSEFEELLFITHKIHGLAATIGFSEVGQRSGELEAATTEAIESQSYTEAFVTDVELLASQLEDIIETG